MTAGSGARLVVTIPLLADIGSAGPTVAGSGASGVDGRIAARAVSSTTTTSAEAPTGQAGHGQRVAGAVLSAVGIVGLGVGGYFGIDSILRHKDSDAHCAGNLCDATGVSQRNDAQQAGTAATIALGAGGAVLLAGIITYVTAPSRHSDPSPAARSSAPPLVAVGPGSISLQGSW